MTELVADIQSVPFGELLRRHRIGVGFTQEELATRAGLSARAIGALENGARLSPHRDTIARLETALRLLDPDRTHFEAAARRGRFGRAGNAAAATPPSTAAAPSRSGSATAALLVGRSRELALVERHLAGEGTPLLLLAGEPGIGKSRLLVETARRAEATGWAVLAGGCQRSGGQELYAPLLDALQHRLLHLRRSSPARLRRALAGCGWLVRLLPELGEPGGPLAAARPRWSLAPEQERRLMFAAVGRFLANIAGPAGALLVLDDLQWASADALSLLAALLRAPAPAEDAPPLRTVGAYRDTEIPPPDALAAFLADLASAGLARGCSLAPLASTEAAELLDHLLASDEGIAPVRVAKERILQRAGGSPFFLVSCAQTLRTRQHAGDTHATTGAVNEDDDIPWDAAQSIRQRVAALPLPVAQDVLAVAAIVGGQAPLDVLLPLGRRQGLATRDVVGGLEALERARLLTVAAPAAGLGDGVAADSITYQFSHDLVREVVLSDLGIARRRRLHREAARALERQPRARGQRGERGELPVERLAYHYLQAGDPKRAVVYLERAGERTLALRAMAEAEGYYRELAAQLDRLGREAEAVRAREQVGTLLRMRARYDQALDILQACAAAYRAAGDQEALVRVMAQIGAAHAIGGTPDAGIVALRETLGTLDASESGTSRPAQALLYTTLGLLYLVTGNTASQLAAAERACEIARKAGDARMFARAEMIRCDTFYWLSQPEALFSGMEDLLPQLEADDDPWYLIFALITLSLPHEFRGEFAQGFAVLARALHLAEQTGDIHATITILARQTQIAYHSGDWERARAGGEKALTLTAEVASTWVAAYSPLVLGEFCLAVGERERASALLGEAIAISERHHDPQVLPLAHALLAEDELLHGQPEAAHRRLVPLLHTPGGHHPYVTGFLPLLAWAALELGEEQQAAAWVAESITRTRSCDYRLLLASALRMAGLLAIRRQHWDEAERTLDEALGLARAIGAPYIEAKVLYVYGTLAAARGKPEQAPARFEQALAILSRLGERPYAERIERELAMLA